MHEHDGKTADMDDNYWTTPTVESEQVNNDIGTGESSAPAAAGPSSTRRELGDLLEQLKKLPEELLAPLRPVTGNSNSDVTAIRRSQRKLDKRQNMPEPNESTSSRQNMPDPDESTSSDPPRSEHDETRQVIRNAKDQVHHDARDYSS